MCCILTSFYFKFFSLSLVLLIWAFGTPLSSQIQSPCVDPDCDTNMVPVTGFQTKETPRLDQIRLSVFHQVFDSGTQRISAVSCALRLLWCVSVHTIDNNCISLFHAYIVKINALRIVIARRYRGESIFGGLTSFVS